MIIGLTGNMGTGKSTVARLLSQKGALHVDADQLAREVVQPGEPAYEDIVAFFGRDVLDEEGNINRKELASIVFLDSEKRKKLEGFIHPRITERLQEIVARQPEGTVIVIDAPLLIEAGLHESVDEVWVTDCDRELQIERIRKRDQLDDEEIEKRLASQMSNEEKRSYADVVIFTNGTKDVLAHKLDAIWQERIHK